MNTRFRLFFVLVGLLMLGGLTGSQTDPALAQSDPVPLPLTGSEATDGTAEPDPDASGLGSNPGIDLPGDADAGLPAGVTLLLDDFEAGLTQWQSDATVTVTTDTSGNQVVALAEGSTIQVELATAIDSYHLTTWFNLTAAALTTAPVDETARLNPKADPALTVTLGELHVVTVSKAGVTLGRVGTTEVLATGSQPYPLDSWQQLDIVERDGWLTVNINRQPALTFDLTGFSTLGNRNGTLNRVQFTGGPVQVDDVALVDLAPVLVPTPDSELGSNELDYNPTRLSGELVNMLDALKAEGETAATSLGRSYLLDSDNKGRIAVQIWAAEGLAGDALVALIEDRDGKVVTVDFKSVTARLGLRDLARLSLSDSVSLIQLVPRLTAAATGSHLGDSLRLQVADTRVGRNPVGAVSTEGFDVTGVQTWHVAGYSGSNIRVAVIDIGFGDSTHTYNNNMSCLVGDSNPGDPIVIQFGTRQTGDSTRGLEMLEVVCDTAPDSEARLYKASTVADLTAAIEAATADFNRVIVIGADFGPNVSPGDGTLGYTSVDDPYAAIQAARNAGIAVIAAAGNSRQAYSTFNYTGGSVSLTITAEPGALINLGWNDWDNNQNGAAPREDLTASLSGAGFTTLNKPARGSGNPAHQFTLPTSCTASGGLCTATLNITALTGSASIVQVQATGITSTITGVTGVTPFEKSGSLSRPADSADVITVGAFCVSPLANYSGLNYSARGPVYLAGGNYTEIGDGPYTGAEVKPDVVGPAQVSTSFSSLGDPAACDSGFGGSQAGAAHVAGQVAVLLSNNTIESFQTPVTPAALTVSLRDYLRTHAFDLPFGATSTGYDMRFGAGAPVLGAADFNPDTLPDPAGFIDPNRVPVGECAGGFLYVGPYNIGAATMDGSKANPYNHLSQAVYAAAAAGINRCVIALPGEYSGPLYFTGLTNRVSVYSYASVVRSAVEPSNFHVHNSYTTLIDGAYHRAAIYVDSTTLTFGGFEFSQGVVYADAILAEPGVLIADSATGVTFTNNTIRGFASREPLVQVLDGSTDVRITNNRFQENVNPNGLDEEPPLPYVAPLTLIVVEDSGTTDDRIVIDSNTFHDNESVFGFWSLTGLPADNLGSTDRTFSWTPLVRTIDSYTDITNNTFLDNDVETLIQAMTREILAPYETRIMGNAIVNNETRSEDPLVPGPLIHLFNMQRIYIIQNTFARNNLENSGAALIIGRGDDVSSNFIDNPAINNNNSGSLNPDQTAWEVHGNLFFDNVRDITDQDEDPDIDEIRVTPADLLNDIELAGVQCKNLAGEANKGTQFNWLYRAAQNPGVCTTAFNDASNNNIIGKDPYPRDDQYVPVPGSVTYILGGVPADRFKPGYYSLTGASDDTTAGDGIDEGVTEALFTSLGLLDFANGFDARGVNRRNDGDGDLVVVIDMGAYELTPLELDNPIALNVNEDTGIVSLELNDEVLVGGFPPYGVTITSFPQYYGIDGVDATVCDSRFELQTQGVIIETLTDGTPVLSYCLPADFHTNTGDPDFTGLDFSFSLLDSSGSSASSTVNITVNPVNDSVLTTSLGDNNPAGDLIDVAVGVGRPAEPLNTIRLRPYVSFEENFFFSERDNTLSPAAQDEVDYDFTYTTPVLVADAGNNDEAYLVDNLVVVNAAQGLIGFDFEGVADPADGFAQAKFQYTVQDQRGGNVTNFITVRAVVPPGDFTLLTPPDLTVFPQAASVDVFTWESSTNAQTYEFELEIISLAVPETIIDVDGLTPAEDDDGLICVSGTCTLTLTSSQQALIGNGEYRWTVDANNQGVLTTASNAPFKFTVNVGLELLKNGSFEQQGDTKKLAKFWDPKKLDNDKRKCNKTGKPPVSYEGECAFLFKAKVGFVTSISQPTTTFGAAGDGLVLTFYASGKNLSGGARVDAKVNYTDGTKEKLRIVLETGTYNYKPFTDSLNLTGPATAKVKIQQKNGTGKFTIDAVSLVLQTDSSYTLATPDNNDVFPSGGAITALTWVESAGATAYDLEVLRVSTVNIPVLELLDLTGTADSDALTCQDRVCRYTLSAADQALLIDGRYRWNVTAKGGFILAPENGPYFFDVVSTTEELLLNGDMEEAASADPKQPKSWKAKKIGDSKLVCDEPADGKFNAYQGDCAYKFIGKANYNGSLQQKADVTTLVANDTLTLRVVLAGTAVVADVGKVEATVFYTDDTKAKITIPVPEGTYSYTLLTNSTQVTKAVQKVKVVLTYKGTTGSYLVDNVSLLRNYNP